ncbi:MAG TPA: sialate O-acetylesterase [Ktedonobacteraceae bacterium]
MANTPLQSYQVLQRDADDKARVYQEDGQVLELPVGGPYTVGDAHDILVGDLWVLAGQSNMEGVGALVDVETPDPFVHSLQMREAWAIAEEPLHRLCESPRLIHHKLMGAEIVPDPLPVHDATRTTGAGLGLTFAKERYRRTGVPIGLIPAAHGGTTMEQWNPELRGLGDASLYGALLGRIESVGGKVAGVLWYQGESDTSSLQQGELYHPRMNALLKTLCGDLRQPDLPFYYVQIGREVSRDASAQYWSGIREAQRTWSALHPHTAMVSTIDLGLDDSVHVDTHGLKRLGRRLADVADGLRAPELVEATYDAERARIHVTYQYVRGGLHASGRPSGFSLRDSSGRELPSIHKVTLQENTATLYLIGGPLPSGTALWYGWGLDPYCNVTDAEDAALPAFGPLPLS